MPTLPEKQVAGSFAQPPVGNHLAVCYGVLDLGTQSIDYGKGKGPESHHQLAILWELPNELTEDGRPLVIHKKYNFSSNEKSNLIKDLQAWRGKAFTDEEFGKFDIGKVVGQACFISCEENARGYVEPKAVAKLPKGTESPPPVNAVVVLDLDDRFNQANFDALTDFWRAIITQSPEYAALSNGKAPPTKVQQIDETDDNDTPF